MAAKGGGSWKVAYADFVTAMMAFFLVMWICGQDQKIKRSVSDYFSDPLGSTQSGSAKKPNRSGSTYEDINSGNVPLEEHVAQGRGRRSFSENRRPGQATKVVADWIHHDKQASAYWQRQAKDQLEAARWSKEVKENRSTAEKTATRLLTAQLQEELAREIPAKTGGIHREMLNEIIQQINWTEIAEDLIEQ
jgi:flagellar motor protein MotB